METVSLGVSGMTCGGCVRSVGNVLKALDGVVTTEVSLEGKRAVVEFDPGKLSVDQLKQAIVEAGYDVTV
jgi:copper chaperone